MKLSKTALIETIRMAIGSQYDVAIVQRTIARNLPLLRGLYRDQSDQFTQDDVQFLQQARSVLTSLDGYTELAENWHELSDADGQDLVDQLLRLKHQLGALACAKEVAELIDQVGRRAGVATAAKSLASREAELISAQIPSCPRCGQQMTLRESNYGEFWGCSRFPDCWGRRPLENQGDTPAQ